MKAIAIIQAHAISWDGTLDKSLIEIEGRKCIVHCINSVDQIQGIKDIVIATSTDPEDDIYDQIAKQEGIQVFHGAPVNVLERFTKLMEQYDADVAVHGVAMHPFINPQLGTQLLTKLTQGPWDMVRPPTRFPGQLGCTAFRLSALHQAKTLLQQRPPEDTHTRYFYAKPLTFIMDHPDAFKVLVDPDVPLYLDEELMAIRERVKPLYADEAPDFNATKVFSPASYMEERYRFALQFLKSPAKVLDVACGPGFGTAFMAEHCGEAVGCDLDEAVIAKARETWGNVPGVSFMTGDAEHLPFEDNQFDAVISMETFEHVPDVPQYTREMCRVLKPGGVFICSTPQSMLPYGRHPYIPWHLRELDAGAFRECLKDAFTVKSIHGVLNGYIQPQSEEGNGMIAICEKPVLVPMA